jgi:hypothetical protein
MSWVSCFANESGKTLYSDWYSKPVVVYMPDLWLQRSGAKKNAVVDIVLARENVKSLLTAWCDKPVIAYITDP